MDTIRQTKLLVDTECIKHNIKEIQKYVGEKVSVMPVIKARSYGTGIGSMPSLFTDLGIKILAVAVVDEGIALRERGYQGEILVLNQPLSEEIDMILEYKLIVSVSDMVFIQLLNIKARENNQVGIVHLEVDTGMGRTGIKPNQIKEYTLLLKEMKNISLEGVFTHFSSSDSDIKYTQFQIKCFDKVLDNLKNEFNLKYIHACNTAGIINFKEAHYNLVRPGIALYGYLPDDTLKDKIDLLPATKLKSKISYIHEIKKGDSVSYNRSYIAKRTTKVAVVPIGYADGIMRSYQGRVVVNNHLVNIIGVVNMDSFMIDITNFKDIKIGDDVYLWDNEIITLEDVAKKCNTISYEIISHLTPRVVKEFK